MWRGMRLALGMAAMLAAACASSGPGTGLAHTEWFGIFVDDVTRAGSVRVDHTPTANGKLVVQTSQMSLQSPLTAPVVTIDRVEQAFDRDGRLLRILRIFEAGHDTSRTSIDIRADTASIRRTTPFSDTSFSVSLPAGVRFDGGNGLIASWTGKPGDSLEFQNFDSTSLAVQRVVLAEVAANLPYGAHLWRLSAYSGEELLSVTEIKTDAATQAWESTSTLFGMTLSMRPISAAEAKKPAASLSVVQSVMVKSPNRIPVGAAEGHIRYSFAFKPGRAFAIPETPEQRVSIADGVATVDICKDCGPQLASTPEALAAARKPTAWMQSDDPKLVELARFDELSKLTDAKKMQILMVRARRVLKKRDYNGHYSALESLGREAGDCTEDAVLLAALGRAAGIPTYVASGLAYSRQRYHGVSNVFLPHNWTLAYVDGAWRSFDLSLEDFDATHIAVSINEGDAAALGSAQQRASYFDWRGLTEVREAPATAP